MSILENIEKVRKNIETAALKSGRKLEDIHLIAVTKTVGVFEIEEALKAGVSNIGENKVQEVTKKYDSVKDAAKWHLIGTLQTNKVKYIIDKVDLIHSLDRIALAEEIDKRAKKISKVMDCLIQVNISLEDSKHGVLKEETLDFVKEVSKRYDNLRIKGLMGMAPFELEPEDTRVYFRQMKKLSDQISKEEIPNVSMEYLSMGMTNDYMVAIEEGANMVRVGTAIFGERVYV